MENANETLGEENARLKLALENLHMLFRDKFQTVSLNDKAEVGRLGPPSRETSGL